MAAVADVDLLSTLHYTLQARPHHSNLVIGFFNVPCLTKLLIDTADGTYLIRPYPRRPSISWYYRKVANSSQLF